MSFGFSIGDFLAVGKLAWAVYKSCRDAPESFNNISMEVLSLHAVLKEVEEVLTDYELTPTKKNSLYVITQGCESVLNDLQSLVAKYEGLSSKSKITWDRMKWGQEDVTEIRARLTSNIVMLTAFMSTTQIIVEKKLNKLVQEFQEGKREGSVITTVTVNSLADDDRQTWRSIRKELEEIGISVAAFESNKLFILQWFQQAVESGAFEETENESGTESVKSYHVEEFENPGFLTTAHTVERAPNIEAPHAHVTPRSSGPEGIPPQVPEALRLTSSREWTPPQKNSPRKVPRLYSLFGRLLRVDNAFQRACERGDLVEAELLLPKIRDIDFPTIDRNPVVQCIVKGDPMTLGWLLKKGADPEVFIDTMPGIYYALLRQHEPIFKRIFELLIYKGRDVDYRLPDKETSLWLASSAGQLEIVKSLLDKEAKPDYIGPSQQAPLWVASSLGHVKIVEELLNYGANVETEWNEKTAIQIACEKGHLITVRYFLENSNATIVPLEGRPSLLDIATKKGYTDVMTLLLQFGAKVDTAAEGFYYALLSGYDDAAVIILKAGFDFSGGYRGHSDVTLTLRTADRNGCEKATKLMREILKHKFGAIDPPINETALGRYV